MSDQTEYVIHRKGFDMGAEKPVTRFWDKDFREVFLPAEFWWVTVDCGGMRWASKVVHSGTPVKDE